MDREVGFKNQTSTDFVSMNSVFFFFFSFNENFSRGSCLNGDDGFKSRAEYVIKCIILMDQTILMCLNKKLYVALFKYARKPFV